MALDKLLSKTAFAKYLDKEYNLTEWLIRDYKPDFGHELDDWQLLQIAQLWKNQKTTVREKFC